MRIGLYGGSFDPVHIGHLLVAQAAIEEAELDRVYFIPAAQSPFKPGQTLSPDSARAAMLRTALAGKTWAEVDTQELERGGISFTIETVRKYRERFPGAQFSYLIGGDHVPQLPKWREAGALAEMLEFVVIPRPGEKKVEFLPPFRGRYLQGFPLGVSASQIRERVRLRLPVDLLVPPGVGELIRNNALYL